MSTMPLSPFYRLYELPWSSTEVVERRFRRVLWALLAVFLVFAVAIPLVPVSERPKAKQPVSERIVNLVLEKKLPPPPPPPPPEVKKDKPPEPVKAEPKPTQTPKPIPDARRRAEESLAQIQDDLAALRELDMDAMAKASQAQTITDDVAVATRSERSLVTGRVGAGSGGINTAGLSRGYGGGSGPLGDITTTKVNAPKSLQGGEDAKRRTASGSPGRSREEVELVFDRNKGAIYALYSRALRENPELKGKVVLELTIAPTGEITNCRIVSSELNDPELERKLVARIKSFRFDAKNVAPVTTTKPIDFFPA